MDVPVEVLQRILANCHPRDVASFSQLCRAAYNLIYHPSDRYLWLQLYLAYPLDHPDAVERSRGKDAISSDPEVGNATVSEIRQRLIDVIKAERAASKGPLTRQEEGEIIQTFETVLQEVIVYENADQEDGASYNGQWLERTLDHSRLLDRKGSVSEDRGDIERTKARLRCCLRSNFKDSDNPDTFRDRAFAVRRNQSRCFVYDLRNYTANTRWGPFTPDNRVNWIHAEHLMNVVWSNLSELPLPDMLRPKLGIEAARPHSTIGNYSAGDWAGVEGTWSRSICFMDHRDLFAFNISYEITNSLNEAIFEDPSFREATRLLEVKLQLVEKSSLRGLNFQLPEKAQANSRHPPLYFKGSSRGPGGVDSMIKGCVYEEEDETIRWRFVREAIYDFSPQWSSSGVQIGGEGSAIGVIGVWTTTEHDDGDPVGPFWLFKHAESSAQVMDFN